MKSRSVNGIIQPELAVRVQLFPSLGDCGILRGMENKRIIPYGVINWTMLVRECLFVDNTANVV